MKASEGGASEEAEQQQPPWTASAPDNNNSGAGPVPAVSSASASAAASFQQNEAKYALYTRKRWHEGRKNPISARSVLIYLQFLGIPFLLVCLWLLIPVQVPSSSSSSSSSSTSSSSSSSSFSSSFSSSSSFSKANEDDTNDKDDQVDSYIGFLIVVSLYYFYSFLCWLAFFDMLLPGCSPWLITLFSTLYVLLMGGYLFLLHRMEVLEEKLAFLTLAFFDVCCVFACFFLHLLISRIRLGRKRRRFQQRRRRLRDRRTMMVMQQEGGGEEGEREDGKKEKKRKKKKKRGRGEGGLLSEPLLTSSVGEDENEEEEVYVSYLDDSDGGEDEREEGEEVDKGEDDEDDEDYGRPRHGSIMAYPALKQEQEFCVGGNSPKKQKKWRPMRQIQRHTKTNTKSSLDDDDDNFGEEMEMTIQGPEEAFVRSYESDLEQALRSPVEDYSRYRPPSLPPSHPHPPEAEGADGKGKAKEGAEGENGDAHPTKTLWRENRRGKEEVNTQRRIRIGANKVEEQHRKREKVRSRRRQGRMDMHCSRYFYNLFCFLTYVDKKRLETSSVAALRNSVNWSMLFWGLVFKLMFGLIWFWLQLFTEMFVTYELFDSVGASIGALILYQFVRVVIFQIMLALNKKLPHVQEVKYFTMFAVPFTFYLYYRNLFLRISGWGVAVAISVAVYLWELILYPMQMLGWWYYFKYMWLPPRLQALKLSLLRCCCRHRRHQEEEQQEESNKATTTPPPEVTYEEHLRSLALEYYYEEVAEYVSLVGSIFFSLLVRWSHNKDLYPSIGLLEEDQYRDLMYRYLYLLGFEILGDIALRLGVHRVLKISITTLGRNLSLLNYRTRFLFALFVGSFFLDSYYSLQHLQH